jgi:hypothetical protein
VSVEVPYDQSWDGGVKVKSEEGTKAVTVVDIMVKVDDATRLRAGGDVKHLYAWVWGQVRAGCDYKALGVVAFVGHDLSTGVEVWEERIVELPGRGGDPA